MTTPAAPLPPPSPPATPGTPRRVSLREDVAIQSADTHLVIDREKSVVRNVKILGLRSKNGRTYVRAAVEDALPMYEGAKCNIDHLPEDLADVPFASRFGIFRSPALTADGVRADLWFNPSHPLAECFLWWAEHEPAAVGFSHNATGEGDYEPDGDFVVRQIHELHSVDLVADPATTGGLREAVKAGRQPQPAKESTDSSGHEHAKDGKFTGSGSSGSKGSVTRAGTPNARPESGHWPSKSDHQPKKTGPAPAPKKRSGKASVEDHPDAAKIADEAHARHLERAKTITDPEELQKSYDQSKKEVADAGVVPTNTGYGFKNGYGPKGKAQESVKSRQITSQTTSPRTTSRTTTPTRTRTKESATVEPELKDDQLAPEAPTGDVGGNESYEAQIGKLVHCVMTDGSLDNKAKRRKINTMLKLMDDGAGDGGKDMEEAEEDEDKEDGKTGTSGADKHGDEPTFEEADDDEDEDDKKDKDMEESADDGKDGTSDGGKPKGTFEEAEEDEDMEEGASCGGKGGSMKEDDYMESLKRAAKKNKLAARTLKTIESLRAANAKQAGELKAYKLKEAKEKRLTAARRMAIDAKLPAETITDVFVESVARARNEAHARDLIEDRRRLVARKPASVDTTGGNGAGGKVSVDEFVAGMYGAN